MKCKFCAEGSRTRGNLPDCEMRKTKFACDVLIKELIDVHASQSVGNREAWHY